MNEIIGELIRFRQAGVAQGHFASDFDKAFAQVALAFNQRLGWRFGWRKAYGRTGAQYT